MRHKGRTALVALVAVFVLGAVASASALAAPPEFVPKSGESFPIKLEDGMHAGFAAFRTELEFGSCSENRTTGEATGPKTIPLTLEWAGCKDGSSSMTSEGAASGHIVIPGTGTLVYIDKATGQVGVLLTLKEVKIEIGTTQLALKGSVVIPVSPTNTESESLDLPLHEGKNAGQQEYSGYENEKGEQKFATLEVVIAKKAAPASIEIAGTNQMEIKPESFSQAVKVSTAMAPPPAYLGKFGAEGTGNVQFNLPEAAAVFANGDVYVADTYNNRVEELSSTGTFIKAWGSEGSGDLQFKDPRAIAVAANGDVYVADSNNERIMEFSSSGTFIRAFGWGVGKAGKAELEDCTTECKAGIAGSGKGQFGAQSAWGSVGPEGIAVAPSGKVYVTDRANARVEEFSETGGYTTKWGSGGSEPGQFWFAEGVAVASNGNVYVADAGNNNVQEFSSSGSSLIARWGSEGSGEGQFHCPQGIAIGPNNDVYVADKCNDRVETFTASGEFYTTWGSPGSKEGQFSSPSGVAVNPSNGDVYVVDQENDRLQYFG
jgi:DNA-binding beta-propeller fold protein YncE